MFLLTAIREHYEHTHDNGSAVAEGLANTARVITVAALIMVFALPRICLDDDGVSMNTPTPQWSRAT